MKLNKLFYDYCFLIQKTAIVVVKFVANAWKNCILLRKLKFFYIFLARLVLKNLQSKSLFSGNVRNLRELKLRLNSRELKYHDFISADRLPHQSSNISVLIQVECDSI